MRSLTIKLTLAFLAVGLTGAMLVALFVGLRTQREFDRFILDRFQADLVQELTGYFEQNGSWEGINAIVVRERNRGFGVSYPAPVVLAHPDGAVIYGNRRLEAGTSLTPPEIRRSVPIEVDGQVVGLALFENSAARAAFGAPNQSPEARFIRRVNQAVLLGALAAAGVALALGIILASTISRPVRELTEATQIIARGDLGHQVPVRTQDEIGELAASFNRMSADLAHANQARRQMTADIAHDLRTPLSIILGYSEALAEGKLGGTPEMYEAMYGEARLLSHLIDDLRTLSLTDAGELPLNRLPTAPADLLARAATAYAPQAEQQGVALLVDAAPALPLVEVDSERMAQVLGNLVSNALRFTPAGGQIELAARSLGDVVALQVRDNGQGIAPEDLPHIFHRFYRAEKSRPQGGESGLGLAIAKGIVEAHQGQIAVASTPGAGTTFTVSLPALV